MKIIERRGDLIQAFINKEFDVIAHQANCFCTAKTGIAPKIFKRFTWIRDADLATKDGHPEKLGTLSFASCDGQMGFNLYGQFHHDHNEPTYGTQYWALFGALKQMRFVLDFNTHVKSIGFPRIGCGAGGGDWNIVEGLIEKAFEGYKGDIFVYSLD